VWIVAKVAARGELADGGQVPGRVVGSVTDLERPRFAVATEAGGGAGSSPNNVIVSPRRPATTPSGIVSATLGTAGRPVSGCTPSGASIGIAAVGTGLTTRGRGADGGGAGAGKTSTNTDACRSSGNSSVARTVDNRIVQATVTCATIENTNV
jgi:hypothetical protein